MARQPESMVVRDNPPLSKPARRRRPLEDIHRKIDRLLNHFGQHFGQPLGQPISPRESLWWHRVPWGAAAPVVDITESEKAFELTAELPGVDTQDVEVKVANGRLSIKGQKQEAKEDKETNHHLHERHFSSLERHFAVPEAIDIGKVEAALKNGLLTVTLPKKSGAQKAAKRIEIRVG